MTCRIQFFSPIFYPPYDYIKRVNLSTTPHNTQNEYIDSKHCLELQAFSMLNQENWVMGGIGKGEVLLTSG